MGRLSAALMWLLALTGGAYAWDQHGIASIYTTRECHGHGTASGERLNDGALTAAHRTLPFGSHVLVRHGSYQAVVRITDRGPYVRGRIIDVTLAAAHQLHLAGLGSVSIELVH